jgi:hypothetical protein
MGDRKVMSQNAFCRQGLRIHFHHKFQIDPTGNHGVMPPGASNPSTRLYGPGGTK